MPVIAHCDCGASYTLKDEFAGQRLGCPKCGAEIVAGTAVVVAAAAQTVPQADPVFDRDVFLLRQQHFAISEKYYVNDEQGNVLCFVQRPAYLGRLILAAIASIFAIFLWWGMILAATEAVKGNEAAAAGLVLFGMLGMFGILFLVVATIMPLRHITFYCDDSKRVRLLEVLQDSKYQFIRLTFTVRDPQGRVLARLKKNILSDIFRRRWKCDEPSGRPLCEAKEDSIILSMLRRLLGNFYGLLRTNFIITRPSGELLGEFNRKFTILDRYVLDLKSDRRRTLDRRLALALGVMLDTGERR